MMSNNERIDNLNTSVVWKIDDNNFKNKLFSIAVEASGADNKDTIGKMELMPIKSKKLDTNIIKRMIISLFLSFLDIMLNTCFKKPIIFSVPYYSNKYTNSLPVIINTALLRKG